MAPMAYRPLPTLWFLTLSLLVFALCAVSFAQGPTPDGPAASGLVSPVLTQPSFENHKFLDRQNRILFIAVAAFNGADFAVTRSNLENGGHELNPLVRPLAQSTPALAFNFAAETAGVVTVSYFLHKTGHHKLERFTSYLSIGSSATAVSYGALHH